MRVMSEEKLNKLAEFIKQYARDNNGESPSLADIMDHMAWSSPRPIAMSWSLKSAV